MVLSRSHTKAHARAARPGANRKPAGPPRPAAATAADVMTTRLVTLDPETPVQAAIRVLLRHRISGAPVVACGPDGRRNRFAGVFSEKTCMRVLLDAAAEQVPCGTVGCYADPEAPTVTEDCDLLTLAHRFGAGKFRRLPVLRYDEHSAEHGGVVVGQVSRRDVLRAAYRAGAFTPDREAARPLYLSGVRDFADSVPV